MDLKLMRRPQQPVLAGDPSDEDASRAAPSAILIGAERKWPRLPLLRQAIPLVLVLAVFLALVTLFGGHRSLPLPCLHVASPATVEKATLGVENGTLQSFIAPKDKLLHGLLASGFDEESCLSRYNSMLYRKESPYLPSPYLLEKLRKYESLHKKCGPNTEFYRQATQQLKTEKDAHSTECNYVVWISYSGLGNRILSIASTFLYALLTNRILLIDRGSDMTDLFCEPFPESSWILPTDFPINDLESFDISTPKSYGNMLKRKVIKNHARGASINPVPAYTYLHLSHDYGDFDKLFFCEDDQRILQNVPWLLLRSNNYFIPSLFLVPTYEEELTKLFPEKDAVFHHLGRYLFHPTNSVWGLISRYYQSYLAKADEKVGIQVRVFDVGSRPFQHVLDQILECSLKEKLLPDTIGAEKSVPLSPNARSIAVVITCLDSGYFEKIKNIYWEHPTATGETVSIHQPSHEGHQQTDKHTHNMKAFAEMYLLSLTDRLVTSGWSTFGYVAQGLGGLQPWILFKPENRTTPKPPCGRALSIEPCFHAPPFYDCKAKKGIDTGILVPHVKHCEDVSWGLKLVNQ